METNFEDWDELKLNKDSSIRKLLASGETIICSTIVDKFNKRAKRQDRTLLITSRNIYNIDKDGFFTKVSSIFGGSSQVKRKIQIEQLAGVTISDKSSEFVIHVSKEYDYRYASRNSRDKILIALTLSYFQTTGRGLPFFFKEEVNLSAFCTTEDDQKKGISRFPTIQPVAVTPDELKTKLEERNKRIKEERENTENLYTKGGSTTQGGGSKISIADFEILKVLGRGAFGKVMLVEKKDNKLVYAIKSLHKEQIIDKDQIEHTKTERYVLEKSSCPFLVSLEYAFQTPQKIFFVMKFMKGGELFQHLRNAKRFDEKRAKFYAAEVLMALEALHKMEVVYRDLKPENILMDEDGHVCLTDFGMAKILKDGEKTTSFVGTPEYLAPEVIEGKGHTFPVDWWALGILIFEMMIGIPPFYNREQNTQKMFAAIKEKEVNFGTKIQISDAGKDLILSLLAKDPAKRLGTNGSQEIKDHKWFSEYDWNAFANKKITPPFKPKVKDDYDTENFDEEFTSEDAYNSMLPDANMDMIGRFQGEFKDFTYVPKNTALQDDQ